MANLKEVRTRIASVSSTQQITSAMKMVSAAKFRKAQNAIIGMRPYAEQLANIVADIDVEDGFVTPYHQKRDVKNVLLVVVASNKGLCGAFNSNVIKQAEARIDFFQKQGSQVSLITLGRRATECFCKRQGLVLNSFDELLDNARFDNVAAFVDQLMDDFSAKIYDNIEVIYNQFKTSLTQIPLAEQFLPIAPDAKQSAGGKKKQSSFIYEPNKLDILKAMVPLTLRSQFYRIILDSLAAEHGSRMTAMQKATDNATELLKELKLSYNKARQAAITNEIIEIVSGSEALKS